MAARSPRRTALYQTLASASSVTSPISCAPGATKAVGCNRGAAGIEPYTDRASAGRWQSGRMRAPAKRLSGLFRSPGSNPGLPASSHVNARHPQKLGWPSRPITARLGKLPVDGHIEVAGLRVGVSVDLPRDAG